MHQSVEILLTNSSRQAFQHQPFGLYGLSFACHSANKCGSPDGTTGSLTKDSKSELTSKHTNARSPNKRKQLIRRTNKWIGISIRYVIRCDLKLLRMGICVHNHILSYCFHRKADINHNLKGISPFFSSSKLYSACLVIGPFLCQARLLCCDISWNYCWFLVLLDGWQEFWISISLKVKRDVANLVGILFATPT